MKISREMFHSEFPKTQLIIPCPKTIICNSCDQNIVSGDKLYDGGKVYKQEDLGFFSSFFRKKLAL